MRPALCSRRAAMVTVVRRTPSICARNFLRQRDGIPVEAIVGLQQQAAEPGLERMQRIARDRLLDLREQEIVVVHNEIANGLTLIGGRMKFSGREPGGDARQFY